MDETQIGRVIRVVLYLRISLDKDGKEAGVDRQREDCQQLADSLGWEVVGEHVDNNISASKFGKKIRKEYLAMLQAIEAAEIDAIIMWDPDRLLRQPKELEALIDLVEGRKLEIRAVMAAKLDLETANGRLIARMLVAVAAHESEHKSERIKRKMQQKRDDGDPHAGGVRCFGYTPDGRDLVHEEAVLIREAASRVLAGETIGHILLDWTHRGVQPSGGGQGWSGSNFKRLLISPRLVAQTRDGQPGNWPAVLDVTTWFRLCAVLGVNKPRQKARRYLLTGMLRCGKCGVSLAGSGGSYRCLTPVRGGCGALSVRAAALDDHVTRMALAAIPAQEAEGGPADEVELLLQALRQAEADITQLAKDHYVEKRVSRPAYMAANDDLEARAAQLRERIADCQSTEDLGSLADIVEHWENQSLSYRQAVLRTVLDRVEVLPAASTRTLPKDRLKFFWRA